MSNVIWNFSRKHNVPYNELVEFVHAVQATTVVESQPQPVEQPIAWPVGSAQLHTSLLGIGKAMAKERSREIGDAWNQLADLLSLLSKARNTTTSTPVALPVQAQPRPLTIRELADVTAPWSNVWTDQSFGIANAAITKFCEVNGITPATVEKDPRSGFEWTQAEQADIDKKGNT